MAKASAADRLIDFVYTGINRRGQKIKGETTSRSLALARATLRTQGITVSNIKKKPKSLMIKKRAIKAQDIAIFTRQLATMIEAGVPLIQSFEIVAASLDNPSMKSLVLKLKLDIESGTTLASALRNHPRYFDDLFCALVESGEQSGSLEMMLERVATHQEKSELLKAKIKKAIKYPLAVIVVAVIVSIILLIKVVPILADLFNSFGSELPVFTQIVVDMSDWMKDWWLSLMIGFGVIFIAFFALKKRSKNFHDFLDQLLLKLPIFGKITYQAIVARFSRTLATTVAAGVPLTDALESTAGVTNNVVFYNATQQIKNDVSKGQQLQFAMRSTKLFPSMAIQLVGVGEESGSLEKMLEKIALYYENKVDNAVDGLTSLMEPIIMVVLGVLVGGLVIAMYLPIFKMGAVVG